MIMINVGDFVKVMKSCLDILLNNVFVDNEMFKFREIL